MKSKIKTIIPLIAAMLLLTSCQSRGGDSTGGQTSGGGTTSGGGDLVIDTNAWGGYYAELAPELYQYGNNLQFSLHKLCLKTHTTIIKYSQFASYISASASPRSIDQSATNPDKNVFFYTGAEMAKNANMTREHVWPCANSSGLWVHSGYSSVEYGVDKSGYWGGGSDLYHVRPSSSYVNTARGNSKFIEFEEGIQTYDAGDSGGKCVLKVNSDPAEGFATKSEPADMYKGDIVRILMYVYIHYAKIGGAEWQWYYDEAKTKCVMGSLGLTQVFGYSDINEVYDLMVRWNELDPVDDHERLRNDTIQAIQGNRNPFVDYPQLIARCFNR